MSTKKQHYPSEQFVECFYCGKKLKRKHTSEHANSLCPKAKGKPWREVAPKGSQGIKAFLKPKVCYHISKFSIKLIFEKKIEEKVADCANGVLLEVGGKRKREESQQNLEDKHVIPSVCFCEHLLKTQVIFVESKRHKSNDSNILESILSFFKQFIPDFRKDSKRLKDETDTVAGDENLLAPVRVTVDCILSQIELKRF